MTTRPALRWHGGKWNLAPWVIGFFPPHRCYVEPFGGAIALAAVLVFAGQFSFHHSRDGGGNALSGNPPPSDR